MQTEISFDGIFGVWRFGFGFFFLFEFCLYFNTYNLS